MARRPSDPKTLAAVSAYLTEVFAQKLLTQEGLAARAGVSQTTVSDANTGTKATATTVRKIAVAMGVRAEDILSGTALVALRKRRPAAPAPPPIPERTIELAPRYPSRDVVADIIRKGPHDPDALDTMMAVANYDHDPGPKGWFQEYFDAVESIAAVRAGRRPTQEVDPAETETAERKAIADAATAREAATSPPPKRLRPAR
jgi:transcriptional regulator with XRE-family HTH domain